MKVGIVIPQGWTGEYAGWQPRRAWQRSLAIARDTERLGFESLWVYDHFQTTPEPRDEITFESFVTLTAAAQATERVRLGHVVLSAGFRNPAVVAKMISTLDVVSGGRAELGIGAGWKEDEWVGYGFGFPPLRERMRFLGDALEVVTRMLAPGRATFHGRLASVDDAINEPRGLQDPRVPIMVGGNGQRVTWGLAARFADELNLNFLSPERVREVLPIIHERCAEAGRDPSTLRLSLHVQREQARVPGAQRIELLASYAEAGIARVQAMLTTSPADGEALASFAADCRAAGVEMEPTTEG